MLFTVRSTQHRNLPKKIKWIWAKNISLKHMCSSCLFILRTFLMRTYIMYDTCTLRRCSVCAVLTYKTVAMQKTHTHYTHDHVCMYYILHISSWRGERRRQHTQHSYAMRITHSMCVCFFQFIYLLFSFSVWFESSICVLNEIEHKLWSLCVQCFVYIFFFSTQAAIQ